jgi:hypothetical protein
VTLPELLALGGLPEGSEDLLAGAELSPEEKARVLEMTLVKAGLRPEEKKEKPTMKKRNFGLMLMAGVLCAGAVVASAAGYFAMKRPLAQHLGAGENEAGLVSRGVGDLAASCTTDGWTISASQVVGDKTQIRVLLEVTAPEGTVLPEGDYRFELPVMDPAAAFTIDSIKDEDPTDNKKSFVLGSIEPNDFRGKTVKLHLEGLSRYKQYTEAELEAGANPLDVDRLVVGDFDLTLKLDYQDTSVTYQPGAEVDTPYGKVKVDEVTLSPLSLFVKLSGEGTVLEPGTQLVFDGELSAFQVDDKGNIIKVDPNDVEGNDLFVFHGDKVSSSMSFFHDGSTLQSQYGIGVQAVDRNGNVIPYQTGDTQPDSVTMTFRGIVDPAEVAAIIINEVEIPLKK